MNVGFSTGKVLLPTELHPRAGDGIRTRDLFNTELRTDAIRLTRITRIKFLANEVEVLGLNYFVNCVTLYTAL